MINFQFDTEAFRVLIREEVNAAITREEVQPASTIQLSVKIAELPPMLTRDQLKQFLHIGDTKAAELLGRADFPVLREAGVLIPTHLLMQWVEANTQWIQKNTKGFRAIS